MAASDPIIRAAPRSDLPIRVAIGLVLIAVAIAALWLGGIALWLLAVATALIGFVEWAGLVRAKGARAWITLAALAVPLALAAPFWWGPDRATVALLAGVAIVAAATVATTRLAAGLAYVGLPIIGLLFLRGQPQGAMLALWTLALVWATDSGAFFAGRRLGGPKLAPALSPAKTWSGLIGGMIAAAIVGALIGALGHLPPATLWLGAPLAVLAQGGDLFESWLKRRAGVKDSGRLLPGHGGVLDRIDGAIPVVTLVAALVAGGAF